LTGRRHPEWHEHHERWRWLLDSLEGGERYRNAIYGYDRRGLPMRNLVRHKREYPDPRDGGVDLAMPTGAGGPSTDDDYELRRARTPVPTFLAEAVETHLSRIYAREVRRAGPPPLARFWSNIDGCGTSIDHWMAETVAPLLLIQGQLDVWIDHPPAPDGGSIATQADAEWLGVDRCIASHILPENMVWWRLDDSERYDECLVLESFEDDTGVASARYRHWTKSSWTLYSEDGEVLDQSEHPYGRVPIVRLFDRKKPRCRNVGQSRYEGVAERQREYYNRDSELILSDTTQAHPLLQGPEDFVQADGTIPIGPSWLLPKKKNSQGGTTTYEGFDVVEFPKEGAESIRQNKAELRDDIDRDSAVIRPSTREGEPQSGLAKLIDHRDGNNRLIKIAKVLARAEQEIAALALIVLRDGQLLSDGEPPVAVEYPADFDLFTASEVASAANEFQAFAHRAGSLPETEAFFLARLMRLGLPGLSDAQYGQCDDEIRAFLVSNRVGLAGKPGNGPGPVPVPAITGSET
jgi:hypothetical protein